MIMKTSLITLVLAVSISAASAAILSVSGNDTLVGNRPSNLIANGSFEADGGAVTNGAYWATGTGFTPTMSLTAWTGLGQVGSYALWGNDGLGGTRFSAPLPHGTNGLYFGGGIMASVNPLPVEAINGLVTFTSTPAIFPKPTDGPVTLKQTISGLNPSSTYVLDFWTSGEEVGTPQFPVDGFFGLDITGEPRLYFAAASGNGPIGTSQRYQVYFTPTASTVTFRWLNWGHYVSPNGMSDELVLDDVILNLVSNSPVALDCNCITNITVTCPGVVPDLCALFSPCFGTNMMPGSCIQNFPPGYQFSAGTYTLNLIVQDLQSNNVNCSVQFTVLPPAIPPPLTVVCPTNKTVECGTGWSFDSPVILSSCCGATVTYLDTTLTQAVCSSVFQRTFTIMDGCGNQATCTQVVTTVDTTPPGRQCGMNLVPNPSFERYTNCSSMISQFDFASPWFTPTDATTDLYSQCAGPWSFMNTPTNLVGVQTPLTGQAYAGAVVWSVYGLNTNNTYRDYREYMEVPLLSPLFNGQRYQVSFYVSRADNYRYAIAELGACITPGPLITNGFYRNFNVVPQVENPSTNLLASTNSWMLVQGTFIANGGESYLTIGNFRTDANTTCATNNPGGPWPDYAYYLFDDVSVVMLCDPLTNKTVQCGQPWVWDFNDQMVLDNCSGLNVTVTSTTNMPSYCPDVIQREWTLTDACGNTNVLTQTVTIVDTNPPTLLCAGGVNLAPNPSFENYAYCPSFYSQVPAAAPWFNPSVATPDYFNPCTTYQLVSTPTNFGGYQLPYAGQAYVGAFVYSRYGTNPPPGYREYIEAPLLSPLVAGITYQVSFRVSLADFSGWAISEIGAHFSAGPIVSNASQSVMSVIPQVVNPSGNPLTSTNSWMLVQGTFTALGGETYMTLGNFRNDATTTAVLNMGTNSPRPGMVDFAYYYYDNISVVPLCSFTNKTVVCGTQWDFDTPMAYDDCSGDYVSVFVTSTTVTGTCPKIYTRVWTIYDACANSMTATQVVTEIDITPPKLLCSGVNIVPNGDFENYLTCPPAFSYLMNAQPWQGWSSEFYHACAPFNSGVSVPANFGGTQTPFSGSGYAGCYVYFNTGNSSNSIREYLETPLIAPLLAGQTYSVSFRVSRGDNSTHAIAQIGAAFSTGNITNYFALTPQVANPSTNILTNSIGWTLVSGTFVATGGENTLTLGNFLQDASTTAQFMGAGPINNSSYYYFDDVKVIAACTNVPVKTVACGAPWSFDPAPLGVDECVGNNVTVTLASTVTNSFCPLNVVRTWTLTDVCGNSTNWSQTVIASTNGGVLTVNCGCLQDSAGSLLTTNACQAVVPNLSVLSNSPCISNNCGSIYITQTPAAGTVVGAGSHNITVKISNCAGITNTCVLPFFVNAPQPTIVCPPNLTLFTCTNYAIANFTPTAFGNTGAIVCSPPSGSQFPLNTTTTVTCTATNSCGASASCTFTVTVRLPHPKFGCFTKVIHIISFPPPTGRIIFLPDFPGGGQGVDFADLSGTDGVRFDLGPAEKFTFSTVLDFNAATNASFELGLPPGGGTTSITPLVRFERICETNCGWGLRLAPQIVSNPTAKFRAAAISDEGELFDSVTVDSAALGTNYFAIIKPMDGNTNALMTVTFDLKTREAVFGLPNCDWTPNARHKGWDGCIYGNPRPRPTGTNKTARIIITPIATPPSPPINELNLRVNNLDTIAFDDPSITMSGRKWGDGHVTLMKAYDDGTERGMEFYSVADGGGVDVELGHAANFQLHMTSLDTNGLPLHEQQFSLRGWPPGTTTNRPPPPVINVRLAPDVNGLGGVDVGADFVDWGVSQATLQLWNGSTLVAETKHVPVSPTNTLATLGGFTGIIGSPGVGIVSLSDTNPIIVTSGLSCGSLGCVGTELRIIAELSVASTPPTAYTGLSARVGVDTDYLIHRLQTSPACSPVPIQVEATPAGVRLDWTADGFHLHGAETLNGPWYDLGVNAPVTLPANSALRFFRLVCD